MRRIVIDPVTRIEGHLRIEVLLDGHEVKEAKSAGTLFRGFEVILNGRSPVDAQQLTQRVCGVCPIAHATAATFALDAAFGISEKIPDNGRIIRNLILGSNILQSHVLHFYHLAALDYVDVAAAADYTGDNDDLLAVRDFIARGHLGPFLPRYEGDYRLPKELNLKATADYAEALRIRRTCHEMLAVFGGRMPSQCGIVPGGASNGPTTSKIASFLGRLDTVRRFIADKYLPDVFAVAGAYADHFAIGGGCKRYLTYGQFDQTPSSAPLTGRNRFLAPGTYADGRADKLDIAQITEAVTHSRYEGDGPLFPYHEDTVPSPEKKGAYSWLKSPRYNDAVYEVGPLASILVNYANGNPVVKPLVDSALSTAGLQADALSSVMGRHLARALHAKLTADAMVEWVGQLKPGEPHCAEWTIPPAGDGCGMVDAPRGAVAHWVKVREHKTANYQLVVPTTWNASPADDKDRPGPMEQALIGTKVKDPGNPFEVVRIVRSFDPCLACAVHLVTPKGEKLGDFRIA
ncbi:MAG: nickel-dependent hydrogenase large subunit [Planctomycetes bacterium]|nr:nickel-dependent hydrogenase large subunit [Planctomycetota bacterium]